MMVCGAQQLLNFLDEMVLALGQIVKKLREFSDNAHPVPHSWQETSTTQRLRRWFMQCMKMPYSWWSLMSAAAPLDFLAMFPAPS